MPYVVELDELQQFLDPCADFRLLRPPRTRQHPQAEGDVLKDIQVPEQRIVLEGKAGLAFAGGQVRDILAVKQDLSRAGVGKFQTGDDAQQRRLAGAGRPEQRDEFAGINFQTHVVQRGIPAEFFCDMTDLDAHGATPVSVACNAAIFFRSIHVLSASVTSPRNASNVAKANAPVVL